MQRRRSGLDSSSKFRWAPDGSRGQGTGNRWLHVARSRRPRFPVPSSRFPSTNSPPGSSAQMSRVLVVEDNADLAFGLRNNLEIEGYEVIVADDGPTGL